jgi:L,D-peptidoglycan transpeptidase YkuD (ErfK/YbiS/YcfS/YnhG family)
LYSLVLMKKLPTCRFAFLIALCFALKGYGQSRTSTESLVLKSDQIIVVVNNDWESLRGKLYAFKKVHGKWQLQFSNAIVLGSKGLGIGDGLVKLTVTGPVKHEGDKRSPAGIFSLGTALGYAERKDARRIKNPYVQAFDTLICVDDANSANYNNLVDKDTARHDYNSFEYMHLKKDYYKWGLFINHNSDPVVASDGSCIFMHIWENDQTGTDGCTAMTEKNMLRVLHWIEAKKNPLLVQMPLDVYKKTKQSYALPGL